MGPKTPTSKKPTEAPEWFLNNCVKTYEELKRDVLKLPLVIQDNVFTPASSIQKCDSYVIDSTVIDPLLKLVLGYKKQIDPQKKFKAKSKRKSKPRSKPRSSIFSNDAVYIRFAEQGTYGGAKFMDSVVQYLAGYAGADLITMNHDDLLDLSRRGRQTAAEDLGEDDNDLSEENKTAKEEDKRDDVASSSDFELVENVSPSFTAYRPDRNTEAQVEGLVKEPVKRGNPLTNQTETPSTSVPLPREPFVEEKELTATPSPLIGDVRKEVEFTCGQDFTTLRLAQKTISPSAMMMLPPPPPPPPPPSFPVSTQTDLPPFLPRCSACDQLSVPPPPALMPHFPGGLPGMAPPPPLLVAGKKMRNNGPSLPPMPPPMPSGFFPPPPTTFKLPTRSELLHQSRMKSGEVDFRYLVKAPANKDTSRDRPEMIDHRPLVVHVVTSCALLSYKGKHLLDGLYRAINKNSLDALIIMSSHSRTEKTSCADCDSSWFDHYGGISLESEVDADSGSDSDSSVSSCRTGSYSSSSSISYRKPRNRNVSGTEATSMLDLLGDRALLKPVLVAPVANKAQAALIKTETSAGVMLMDKNIRNLQRAMRKHAQNGPRSRLDIAALEPLLQPYAAWEFLDATTREVLRKKKLKRSSIDSIVAALNNRCEARDINAAITQVLRRNEVLEQWFQSGNEYAAKWDQMPIKTLKKIEKIDKNRRKYAREAKFLDSILGPSQSGAGWPEVAIEPETRAKLSHFLSQHSNSGTKRYGILKDGGFGGAFIYGVSGTGKSHLAQIIATESSMPTIHVSAVDLKVDRFGDSEKAFKALLNLAEKIAPSVIFIDDAEAILRDLQRSDENLDDYEVEAIINWFFLKLNSVSKAKTPVYYIVATNAPHDIDPRVLRRLPYRIYLELPSEPSRERIFAKILEDETLGADVTINYLAAKCKGYTGSDIRNLCVQVALSCDTFVHVHNQPRKRLLGLSLFDAAIADYTPMISPEDLVQVKKFAQRYDPSMVREM